VLGHASTVAYTVGTMLLDTSVYVVVHGLNLLSLLYQLALLLQQ